MSLDKFGIGAGGKKKSSTPKKTTESSKPTKKSSKATEENDFFDEVQQTDTSDEIDAEAELGTETAETATPNSTSPVVSKKKTLKCTLAKCGYKRVLFKKTLDDADLVCQKCGAKMKLV